MSQFGICVPIRNTNGWRTEERKLKLGVHVNSSVVEAFTEGNILFQSLQLAPLKPSFNHLTANFADEKFEFVTNSITFYDIDHAKLIGGATSPLFLKSNVNLSGSSSKSQAARIVSVRLREELGGITADQWKQARQVSFRTTVLALNTEPGMVCSMTHPDMPGGAGEFRVTGWRLNKDFSIDIQGRTTTDDMYNLVAGPSLRTWLPIPCRSSSRNCPWDWCGTPKVPPNITQGINDLKQFDCFPSNVGLTFGPTAGFFSAVSNVLAPGAQRWPMLRRRRVLGLALPPAWSWPSHGHGACLVELLRVSREEGELCRLVRPAVIAALKTRPCGKAGAQ